MLIAFLAKLAILHKFHMTMCFKLQSHQKIFETFDSKQLRVGLKSLLAMDIKKIRSACHRMAALICMAFFVGCAGPKDVSVVGEAAPGINRNAQGQPLSVLLRIYQLKSSQAFSHMTFDSLASGKPESELLGNTLISMKEMLLLPGGKVTLPDTLQEETQYVGVVGLFRRPDAHHWRFLVSADDVRSKGLTFRVQDCYLQPIKPKQQPIPGQPSVVKAQCESPYR
ncbi:type VI secretion system lipoprotein TssJ [Crenobacter sp. SG2305]|uniref:type VI secretion system lipoprotein TssJ n=1 Tax=Crenobacter oryzisoli TaxID=3056844 RepID=UPI0025AA4EF3|nr:type VI secretion system lipoprotein TssJ [Crenobacter sp. SG2305]MDN0083410.1 type VI secretion system lipoprotein TssJ [Crenobacter sp. SG2305]